MEVFEGKMMEVSEGKAMEVSEGKAMEPNRHATALSCGEGKAVAQLRLG